MDLQMKLIPLLVDCTPALQHCKSAAFDPTELFLHNKIKHVKLLSFTLIEYCPVIYVLIQIKGSCCKAHSTELSAKYVKSF